MESVLTILRNTSLFPKLTRFLPRHRTNLSEPVEHVVVTCDLVYAKTIRIIACRSASTNSDASVSASVTRKPTELLMSWPPDR